MTDPNVRKRTMTQAQVDYEVVKGWRDAAQADESTGLDLTTGLLAAETLGLLDSPAADPP